MRTDRFAAPQRVDRLTQAERNVADHPRPAIDEGSVDLNEIGAGLDFGERGFRVFDPAAADQSQRALAAQKGPREQPGRRREQRPPGKAAGLLRFRRNERRGPATVVLPMMSPSTPRAIATAQTSSSARKSRSGAILIRSGRRSASASRASTTRATSSSNASRAADRASPRCWARRR